MEKLDKWIAQQKRRHDRFVSVHEALLGSRPTYYLAYRLRYFFIVTMVALAAHIIEFSLLYFYLKKMRFVSIISFKIIFMLVTGTWWGTLEIMRERIRRYNQSKKTREIGVEITLWIFLGFTVNVILLVTTLPISYSSFKDLAQGHLTLFDTYIIIILFQTFCSTFVRTLHSGCFALKRVFRPLTSIIIYDIATVLIILALLHFFKAFSLPLGVGISAILNLIISTYYSLNMYRFLHINPFKLPRLKHIFWRIKQLFSVELLLTSCASLFMQVENVIVLVLIFHDNYAKGMTTTAILLYFISPLIRASFDWIKLFYYDLKKYAHPLYKNMVAILNKYIQYISIFITIVFWIISFILSISFNLYDLPILLVLFPLFFFRSIIAHLQMHRFTEMRFWDIITSGGIAALGILLPSFLHFHIYHLFWTVIGFMVLACIYLKLFKTRAIETDGYHPAEIGFYIWYTALKNSRHYLLIAAFKFSDTKAGKHSKSFIHYIHNKISYRPKMARLDEATVVLYELKSRKSITIDRFTDLAAGTIYQEFDTPNAKNGIIAAKALMDANMITAPVEFEKISALLEGFQKSFPDGICLNLLKPIPNTMQQLSKEDLSIIFYHLMHFLNWPMKILCEHDYHVTAAIEKNSVKYIFIIPRVNYDKPTLQNWQFKVHNHNVKL